MRNALEHFTSIAIPMHLESATERSNHEDNLRHLPPAKHATRRQLKHKRWCNRVYMLKSKYYHLSSLSDMHRSRYLVMLCDNYHRAGARPPLKYDKGHMTYAEGVVRCEVSLAPIRTWKRRLACACRRVTTCARSHRGNTASIACRASPQWLTPASRLKQIEPQHQSRDNMAKCAPAGAESQVGARFTSFQKQIVTVIQLLIWMKS